MKNKDFWKGFVLAAVLVIGLPALWRFAVVNQWRIPLQMPMSKETKADLIEEFLDRYYVEDFDAEALEEATYAGLVAGVGDRYTYYLPAEAMGQYLESAEGHFEGIGVEVFQDENGNTIIYSVMPGQPAESAGILAEDMIVGVDGESVVGEPLDIIVGKMRGEAGTAVDVEVYRPATGETFTCNIVREDVAVVTVQSELLEDDIGYIQLAGFKDNSYDQFKLAMDELSQAGMKGLILDLRDNPGGLVKSVYQIGEELLPQGTMVYTEDKHGNREDLVCDAVYNDIPLVVLVNGNSASASEIFAGATKDSGRGEIVGTQTFGKGLVQRLFFLPDGSGLNVTIQKYYTPNGTSIHGIGVEPDYVVEPTEISQEQGGATEYVDTQLEKAVSLLQ